MFTTSKNWSPMGRCAGAPMKRNLVARRTAVHQVGRAAVRKHEPIRLAPLSAWRTPRTGGVAPGRCSSSAPVPALAREKTIQATQRLFAKGVTGLRRAVTLQECAVGLGVCRSGLRCCGAPRLVAVTTTRRANARLGMSAVRASATALATAGSRVFRICVSTVRRRPAVNRWAELAALPLAVAGGIRRRRVVEARAAPRQIPGARALLAWPTPVRKVVMRAAAGFQAEAIPRAAAPRRVAPRAEVKPPVAVDAVAARRVAVRRVAARRVAARRVAVRRAPREALVRGGSRWSFLLETNQCLLSWSWAPRTAAGC